MKNWENIFREYRQFGPSLMGSTSTQKKHPGIPYCKKAEFHFFDKKTANSKHSCGSTRFALDFTRMKNKGVTLKCLKGVLI